MTTKIACRTTIWLTALALISTGLRLGAQRGDPTPAQREVFSNVDRLESKLTLDQEEYLPRETIRVTVTLRNPTAVPLRIPQPFHQQTGSCDMILKGVIAPGVYGDEQTVGAGFTANFWNVPTIVLAPGEEVTTTASLKDHVVWQQVWIPDRPGEWRMKYSYDKRMGANFRVVRPTKLWAISIVHLPPTEEMDYEVGKPTVKSAVVPFLAIETLPGEYWLFRGDPRKRELSPWPLKEFTLDVLYSQIPFFERVRRLDEPVASLQTELHADDTVDVRVQSASGRVLLFNVPSARTSRPTPVH